MEAIASVAGETGTLKAAERVCTVSEYITGPIFTLVLVCNVFSGLSELSRRIEKASRLDNSMIVTCESLASDRSDRNRHLRRKRQ